MSCIIIFAQHNNAVFFTIMHMCVHTYVRTYVHTINQSYVYIYIFIYIYIQIQVFFVRTVIPTKMNIISILTA